VIATVTLPRKLVALLPKASRALTWIAGVIVAPAISLLGWTVKASCVAAPAVTSNAVLVVGGSAGAVTCKVYPLPALSILKLENTATPLTAATVRVPDSVPLAGLVPIAIVTEPVKPVAVLPNASRAVTRTAGEMAAPAVVVTGGTVKLSCVAGPGVILNAPLVRVRMPDVAASR
jgi:hypothetical protein